MSDSRGPVLTDRKRMGGLIAQDGFDYQVWNALAQLPNWLRNDAFEGMIFEGFEDFEARFFAPHTPHQHFLDRFQAKSGSLSNAEVRSVMVSFYEFDRTHPDIARVHTLVTPILPATISWMARDIGRVRRARPFYEPFAGLQRASDDQLHRDLVDEFGEDLGPFIFESVEVECKTVSDRRSAQALFAAAFAEAFPELDPDMRKIADAFSALHDLAGVRRGAMLTKAELLRVLSEKLSVSFPDSARLRVHIRSDRNEEAVEALEIDAGRFSGGSAGFPGPEEWAAGLLSPLGRTAIWARKLGYERIRLSGSYRLSTAMAVGWSLRSAIGFEFEILTRSGFWATDDRSAPDDVELPWSILEASELVRNRLIATIGVIRDPAPDVANSWGLDPQRSMFVAMLPQAITTAPELQASISKIKTALAANATRLGATGIDLFLAGPAAFAVALGHRWNALPPTQLHEFVAPERRYVPTVQIA